MMPVTSHQRPSAMVCLRIISSERNSGEGGKATSTTIPVSSPTAPVGLMRM